MRENRSQKHSQRVYFAHIKMIIFSNLKLVKFYTYAQHHLVSKSKPPNMNLYGKIALVLENNTYLLNHNFQNTI